MTPLPQSLVDRAELLARSMPLKDVAAVIGVQPSQITRMKRRGWKAADYSSKRRPIPSDFAWMANRMTFRELAEHYRAGTSTVARWMRERPPLRPSLRGRELRIEPATGKRVWQSGGDA